jgi:hypothetical protein
MKNIKMIFAALLMVALSLTVGAQTRSRKSRTNTPPPISQEIKSSPAYAEVLFRKVVLEVELEDLLERYTTEFPKVKEAQYELSAIRSALSRITRLKTSESKKLTLVLGKMLVQQARYIADMKMLLEKYNDKHPDVKRAKRKSEIFGRAINEIL